MDMGVCEVKQGERSLIRTNWASYWRPGDSLAEAINRLGPSQAVFRDGAIRYVWQVSIAGDRYTPEKAKYLEITINADQRITWIEPMSEISENSVRLGAKTLPVPAR